METFLQDLRYAVRALLRAPGFTAAAVLTLALGIGANTAIFSVVNAVLLRSLPYPDPDRLVSVFHFAKGNETTMSPANFEDLRAQATSYEAMAAYYGSGLTLTGRDEAVRLEGAEVTGAFFDVLGVRPLLGRGFRPDENEAGKSDVAVLSHSLWKNRFAGDRGVVGRTVLLDGTPHTVVGVMPEGFSFPARRDVWIPVTKDGAWGPGNRGAWWISVIGRLKEGVTPERADTEARAVAARLEKAYPDVNTGVSFTALPAHEAIVGDVRGKLLVLLAGVGFVLLIACANVANLLLARSAARRGEIAVRIALGAGRGRLVRQFLTESAILGLLGGGAGLLLALYGTEVLVALKPQGIPRLDGVGVDGTVVAFTLGLSLLTGLLFGLVPALQLTRPGLVEELKEGGRGTQGGRRSARTRGALVLAQTALAVMLLAAAGLLLRSFLLLQGVDPGFEKGQALVFRVSVPGSAYDDARAVVFYDRLLERMRAIPGVQQAGAVMGRPMGGLGFGFSFEVDGWPEALPGQAPVMETRVATPDYFRAMGIPLLRGRAFTAADRAGSPQVVVLSESGVRKFFPNEDPMGKRIQLGWGLGEDRFAGGTVVGIVRDVKHFGLDEEEEPEIYLPHAQTPMKSMDVVLRTAVAPTSVLSAVRREVAALDPNVPVFKVETLEEVVGQSVSQPRFYTLLLGIFAAVALALAGIGIFGVTAYGVAQRTRELGIRMALGATAGEVVGLVVRQGMRVAAAGVALGLVGALLATRALRSMLFGVGAGDPITLVGVTAFLAAVALLACWIPARRAARLDPMAALRSD